MSTFVKWPDIESFANVKRRVDLGFERAGVTRPVVDYIAKVKLHGTNAAVRIDRDGTVTAQSRNRDISVTDDNCGFAAFVEQYRDEWSALCEYAGDETPLVVFGEWIGPGIMVGTACNLIPEKVFAVYAIRCWPAGSLLLDGLPPGMLPSCGHRVRWIPVHGVATVDFSNAADVSRFVESVNDEVSRVEACDPFIRRLFGVEGTGEGLVLYPDTRDAHIDFDFVFKAKGEAHRVKKEKAAASSQSEVPKGVTDFIAAYATEARFLQGLAVIGGEADKTRMGDFLRWVVNDIEKESVADLEDAGLEWKQVVKPVTGVARIWFQSRA